MELQLAHIFSVSNSSRPAGSVARIVISQVFEKTEKSSSHLYCFGTPGTKWLEYGKRAFNFDELPARAAYLHSRSGECEWKASTVPAASNYS